MTKIRAGRVWVVIGVIAISTVAVLLLYPARVLFAPSYVHIQPVAFDSQKWIQGDFQTRGSMGRDLVDRKLLIGKTRAEAEELLGPPDGRYNNHTWYQVDMGFRFMNDVWFYQLELDFDEASNRVIEVTVDD